jgi:hypothetical protein
MLALFLVFVFLFPAQAFAALERGASRYLDPEPRQSAVAADIAAERLTMLVELRLSAGKLVRAEKIAWKVRRAVKQDVRRAVEPRQRETPAAKALPERDPGHDKVASLVSRRCLDLAEKAVITADAPRYSLFSARDSSTSARPTASTAMRS